MVLLFNHPPASIFLGVVKFLTWLKVDLVFTILNVMCECVSAALEQVAGNRLGYVSGGFGCSVVAIGFAVGELLWMKKMKLHIGILDSLGFLAALSQVASSGLQLIFSCLHKSSPINFSVFSLIFALLSAYYKIIWKSRTHKFFMYCKESTHYLPLRVCQEIHPTKTLFECPICATPKLALHNDGDHIRIPIESLKYAPQEVGEWIFYVNDQASSNSDEEQVGHDSPTSDTSGRQPRRLARSGGPALCRYYSSDSDEQVVHDPPTIGTSGLRRPPSAREPRTSGLRRPAGSRPPRLGFNPEFFPSDSSSGDEEFSYGESIDNKKEI